MCFIPRLLLSLALTCCGPSTPPPPPTPHLSSPHLRLLSKSVQTRQKSLGWGCKPRSPVCVHRAKPSVNAAQPLIKWWVRADWDFRLVYSELSSAVSLCCGPRFFPPWLPDWRHSHYAVRPPPMTFRLFVKSQNVIGEYFQQFFFFFCPSWGGGGGSPLSFLRRKGRLFHNFGAAFWPPFSGHYTLRHGHPMEERLMIYWRHSTLCCSVKRAGNGAVCGISSSSFA